MRRPHVSVSSAKAQLTDLVRRVPVALKPTAAEKRALLEELYGSAKGKPGVEGVTAATIDDFLYDEDGLPA